MRAAAVGPLAGKRVLVARAAEQAGRAAALLRDAGGEPVVVPVLVMSPPADPAPLERALRDLAAGAYGWVAFTSANGAARTLDALAHLGLGLDACALRARVGAVGPATAEALSSRGVRADVVATELHGEGLAAAMLSAMGGAAAPPGRVLLPRAARARDALSDALRAAGWVVDAVVAYETHPPPAEVVAPIADELRSGRLDAVLLTSSSTVDHLCDALGPEAAALLSRARLASIGPLTTETALARGLRVDVAAPVSTLQGLIDALSASYSSAGPEPVA